MTITIELPPDVEASLRSQAARQGLNLVDFLVTVAQREAARTLSEERKRRILEFEGVGSHGATGQDAQSYVNTLRDEWDDRP